MTMKKLSYLFALLFLASTIFIACGSDDPIEPEPPPPPPPETMTIDVENLAELYDVRNLIQNPKRNYEVNVTGNILVNAQTLSQLSVVGALKDMDNVDVDWGTHRVMPDGLVRIGFDQWQNNFGQAPLGFGFTAINAADVEKFANAGIDVLARYNGEDVTITNADQLITWFYIVQEFVTEENNGVPVNVAFNETLGNGSSGLRVENVHIQYLEQIGNYANITNKNIKANEPNVIATLELLHNFTIHGNGTRFNDGNMFKILGLTDADLKALNTNGEFLRTDTASFSRMQHQNIVPNRAFVDVQGMNTAVLKRLSGLENHTVMLLPVGNGSFFHMTHELMQLLSPASFNRGTPWQSERPLRITPKTNNANPTLADFYGAIQLIELNDMHSDWSFQLMEESIRAAGAGQRALVNTNIIFYTRCAFSTNLFLSCLYSD